MRIPVVALCVADILTTEYVVRSGIGYESNELLAPILGYHIYVIKLIFTILTVLEIERAEIGPQLRSASYLTLFTFYIVVVINNVLVIVHGTDLNLNLNKLLLIFVALFTVNLVGSTVAKIRGVP